MKILIAEDDPIPRRLLQATLTKWEYEVVIASDGEEAWQILQSEDAPKIAILDWLMPGMDGVEVCRKVRQRKEAPYIYMILLTSKDRKEDIVEGMEAGADDYLIKPFETHRLQVRLRAGRRIIDLQTALMASVEALEQARRREGEIGARIQQTLLLGQPPHAMSGVQIAALTIPSQHVDGDFYDFYPHNDRCLDIIVGDVMGKGVPAALLGAAVKSHFLRALSHLLAEQGRLPDPEAIITAVHSEVTRQFIGLDSFMTLCYARFDQEKREITFVDCGHTKTILLRSRTGEVEMLQGENMPLGISVKEVYQQVSVPFEPGDLCFFYSDGVTEARNESGDLYGTDRLVELVKTHRHATVEDLLQIVRKEIVAYSHSETFADDLTCVVIRMASATIPLFHAALEVSSRLEELATLRSFVRSFCRDNAVPGLDEDSLGQLELAVNEAASNVMRHAYHGRGDGRIQVEADAFADHVCIRLRHFGDVFDPETARPPTFDGSRDGGFGVYMIAQSVDEVRYSQDADGSSTVHLVKMFPPPLQPPIAGGKRMEQSRE